MKINPKLSEATNVLRHVLEINDFDKRDFVERNYTFGTPIVHFALPATFAQNLANHRNLTYKNTKLEIRAGDNAIFGGSAMIAYYRRLHVAKLWWDTNPTPSADTGRFTMYTNVFKYPVPTLEEVNESLKDWVTWVPGSIDVTMRNVVTNRTDYDTGTVRLTAKPGSLCYVGYIDIPVEFAPASWLPETMGNGFVDALNKQPVTQALTVA